MEAANLPFCSQFAMKWDFHQVLFTKTANLRFCSHPLGDWVTSNVHASSLIHWKAHGRFPISDN